MRFHRTKIIASLFIPGLLIGVLSCKMKKEEAVSEPQPIDNYIRLSDAQIQLANINVAEAREGTIGRRLSLTGVLKVNEQSVVTISSRLPGRIEKLFFKNTGDIVNKGDELYEFYSDDLIDAQREYYTLQSNNWNFSGKYEPSLVLEDKLLVMGLMPSQIKQLGKDGKIMFKVIIYSPGEGKIRSVNVSEGQYITPGQTLFELAADKNLWLEAQVYPDDIQYLKTGMPATATVPLAGELPVKCNISFINPAYEKGKNVTLVRAVINNDDNRLHPGMLALLNVQTQMTRGILVPSSAVITGSHGERVWIREGNGDFTWRQVTTGMQSGDSILVLSGLEKSDQIVTTGAYLLNSELILKQGTGSMSTTEITTGNNRQTEIKTTGM